MPRADLELGRGSSAESRAEAGQQCREHELKQSSSAESMSLSSAESRAAWSRAAVQIAELGRAAVRRAELGQGSSAKGRAGAGRQRKEKGWDRAEVQRAELEQQC